MSETEYPTPERDASLPPPPADSTSPGDAWPSTRATDTWSSAPEESPARRGPKPAAIVAAVVALALVAGVGTFLVLRSAGPATGSGPATALTLTFDRGDQTTYDIHMKMDGSLDLGAQGTQPLSLDASESVAWKVLRVAKDGTATVRMSVNGISGSVNGQPLPPSANETATTFRVTPDGQIVDANGLALGSVAGNPMSSFPGMDQVTPILPDQPVKPGDQWDKHFSQSFPFGNAKIEYTAHSTFERYEQVNGVRAAVISTDYTVPLDFTIDLGQLAKAFGGGDTSAVSGKNGTITYAGNGKFTQTSWLDLKDKQLVKGATTGSFDMTITAPALAGELGTDHISMSGSFSLDLTRR